MIVDKVDFLNIDTLYDIVVDRSKSEYYSTLKFNRTYSELLNHITVSFQLSNVTMYEYFFLKKYSTRITDFIDSGITPSVVENTYPELKGNKLDTFFNFLASVYSDIDKDYMMYYIPSGFVTGKCVVIFSGLELRSLLGFELDNFFKLASREKCVLNDKYNPDYRNIIYEDEDFSNYIITIFMNGFYKYLLDASFNNSNDVLSDTYNYKKFISNVGENGIQLTSIRNPFFNIDFINDDMKDICNIFNSYKEKADSKFTFDNTLLEFNLDTSFSVLVKLYSILPKDRFISIESFGILRGSDDRDDEYECPEELKDKFENRFYGRLDALYKSIKDTYYRDNTNVLKRLELFPNYRKVKYSILVSFSDISYILNEYVENNNENSFIVDKVTSSINNIIKLSKTIYNSLK